MWSFTTPGGGVGVGVRGGGGVGEGGSLGSEKPHCFLGVLKG